MAAGKEVSGVRLQAAQGYRFQHLIARFLIITNVFGYLVRIRRQR